jgi:hypothetical protein
MKDLFAYTQTIPLLGIATNLSANQSAGVKCQLSAEIQPALPTPTENELASLEVLLPATPTHYRLHGVFDNVNLFGKFDIIGTIVTTSQDESITCFQFSGELLLNSPKSGFKRNTKSSFVITLSISSCGAKGIYHIGKLPSFDFDQYGTLELFFEKPHEVVAFYY